MLAELKRSQEQAPSVESKFNYRKFRTFYNPAHSISTGRNHGGEIVATRKYLNAMPIDKHVLDHIQETFEQKLSFAAAYLRLRKVTIV